DVMPKDTSAHKGSGPSKGLGMVALLVDAGRVIAGAEHRFTVGGEVHAGRRLRYRGDGRHEVDCERAESGDDDEASGVGSPLLEDFSHGLGELLLVSIGCTSLECKVHTGVEQFGHIDPCLRGAV